MRSFLGRSAWFEEESIPVLPEREPLVLPPQASYLVGLDLGQANDATAFVVVSKIENGDRLEFEVVHAERIARGTPYPTIARNIVSLMRRSELNPPAREEWHYDTLVKRLRHVPRSKRICVPPLLVVDATGVGRPVMDMLRNAGLRDLVGITFTGGQAETIRGYNEYNVAKQNLVASVQAVLSDGRIKFARGMRFASEMKNELLSFRIKVTPSANETYGAASGKHDDLVTALCMPIWYADYGTYHAGAL